MNNNNIISNFGWIALVSILTIASCCSPVIAQSDDEEIRRVFVTYESGNHDLLLQLIRTTTSIFDPLIPITIHHDFQDLSSVVISAPQGDLRLLQLNPLVSDVVDDNIREFMFMPDSIKPYVDRQGNILREGDEWNEQQDIPYGVALVQAPEAWAQNVRGGGVKVCVLDTGLDESHEDLNQNNVDGFEDELNWGSDRIGHGTHVTGTIAAANNDYGVVGVAPDAEIYTVKVFTDNGNFDAGDGGVFIYSSGLIEAANKCVDAQANIISMSLGGPIWNPLEYEHFTGLFDSHGIISVAAAGNGGTFVPQYPASYSGVISVGAIDENKNIAPFSQRNRHVDLVAPGVDVLSLLPSNGDCNICQGLSTNDAYGSISGTSMATPHVAGVAALLWSFRPEATAGDIIMAMLNGAEGLGGFGFGFLQSRSYGNGLVNTAASMEYLHESLQNNGEDCDSDEDCTSGSCTRWFLFFGRRTCD